MHLRALIGFAGICLLTACGGNSSSNNPSQNDIITTSAGAFGKQLSRPVSYDPANDTVVFGSIIYANTGHSFLPDEIDTFANTTLPGTVENHYAVRGVTPSGSGTAMASLTGNLRVDRLDPSIIPTSGTARYTGDYAGIYVNSNGPGDVGSAAHVLGRAEVVADFGFPRIFFNITERTDFRGNPSHSDLNMPALIGANGTFGGQIESINGSLNGHTDILFELTSQEVIGAFTGVEGQEVVGGFRYGYKHNNTASNYAEKGVFVLSKE